MFNASKALCKCGVTLSLLVSLPLLSACAVQTPPEILNSTGGAAGTRNVVFVTTDEDSALRKSFRENLQTAFKDRAIAHNDKADLIGDFAISILPADVELASTVADGGSSATNQTAIAAQSAARKPHFLDKCEAVRFRASLVLFDRKSGERVHRAESEAFGCKSDQAPLRQLAKALVDNAILSPR